MGCGPLTQCSPDLNGPSLSLSPGSWGNPKALFSQRLSPWETQESSVSVRVVSAQAPLSWFLAGPSLGRLTVCSPLRPPRRQACRLSQAVEQARICVSPRCQTHTLGASESCRRLTECDFGQPRAPGSQLPQPGGRNPCPVLLAQTRQSSDCEALRPGQALCLHQRWQEDKGSGHLALRSPGAACVSGGRSWRLGKKAPDLICSQKLNRVRPG